MSCNGLGIPLGLSVCRRTSAAYLIAKNGFWSVDHVVRCRRGGKAGELRGCVFIFVNLVAWDNAC